MCHLWWHKTVICQQCATSVAGAIEYSSYTFPSAWWQPATCVPPEKCKLFIAANQCSSPFMRQLARCNLCAFSVSHMLSINPPLNLEKNTKQFSTYNDRAEKISLMYAMDFEESFILVQLPRWQLARQNYLICVAC